MKLKWWIVPLFVAAFLVASYGLAKTIHFPTQTVVVEAHEPEPGADLETVELTVQNLKCWGTSNAFTEMLSQIPGVVKIQTYTRTNKAVITFDSGKTSPEQLTETINQPMTHHRTGEHMRVFTVLKMEMK